MNIHQIMFSPTGGTRRVCEYICDGIDQKPSVTDLCVKERQIRLPEIHEEDLVIIAMPVFAGRVPALAVDRLKRIQSNHAKCVVVAVYGNRAYDDALLEMQDVATEMGFRVVAAVSAVAEHSIARVYAAGRPDAEDRKELAAFGVTIINKVESMDTYNPLSLPGNRPYRAGNTGPFPTADERCTGCGTCRELCPADAIPADNLRSVNKEACISCMRCLSVCPTKVRNIGQVKVMVTEKLKTLCATRKSNELFV
ncbi:MAG: EFR1 family ferrodoxin [Prevotella sp.]|nr:EFR1 family ferrodoxin [Prevotella sp.]